MSADQYNLQQYRIRFQRMYIVYNPSKLKEIEGMLKEYLHCAEDVLERMVDKYGPQPSDEQVVLAASGINKQRVKRREKDSILNIPQLLSLPSSRSLKDVERSLRNSGQLAHGDVLELGGHTPVSARGEASSSGNSNQHLSARGEEGAAGGRRGDTVIPVVERPNTPEEETGRSPCCCYCKCCPRCFMFWRCCKHNIRRDVHPKYRGLVRYGFFVWFMLVFCLALDAASFMYVIAYIDKTFEVLQLKDFFNNKWSFQFGVSWLGLAVLPVPMFFWLYYTLYTAVEYHHGNARRKLGGDTYGSAVKNKKNAGRPGEDENENDGDPTNAIRTVSDAEAASILASMNAESQVAANRHKKGHAAVDNDEDEASHINIGGGALQGGEDSKGAFLLGQTTSGEVRTLRPDLKFAHRRRLLLTLTLFAIGLVMAACVVAILGPHPWPCPGIIFMLQVRHEVDPLYQKSGLASQGVTLNQIFFKTVALPIVASSFWLILFILCGTLFIKVSRVLKNKVAIVFAVLFAIGMLLMALLITFLNTGANIDNFFGIPKKRPDVVRGLCFKNSCGVPIRVGQVGGATGIDCVTDANCPNGTICNTKEVNPECYFQLSLPAGQNVYLGSGGSYCYPFENEPVTANIKVGTKTIHNLVQWSGSIYGSTGCNGGQLCETGMCKDCDAYQGPIGPVTSGEFTLQVHGLDYYDVTIINGMNVPLSVTPQSPTGKYYANPDTGANASTYYCKAPGNPKQDGTTPGASWKFTPPNTMYNLIGSRSSSNALTAANANGQGCVCGGGDTCGRTMGLTSGDLPTPDVSTSMCGDLVGMWTDDEICAWTSGQNNYEGCKTQIGTLADQTNAALFGCDAGYSSSCFQPNAKDSECCGCTVWDELGLGIRPVLHCKGHNPLWKQVVYPKLSFMKKACPTCYTYPYDDATSLFTCRSEPAEANATNPVNENRYEIEFCPSGVTLTSEPVN